MSTGFFIIEFEDNHLRTKIQQESSRVWGTTGSWISPSCQEQLPIPIAQHSQTKICSGKNPLIKVSFVNNTSSADEKFHF